MKRNPNNSNLSQTPHTPYALQPLIRLGVFNMSGSDIRADKVLPLRLPKGFKGTLFTGPTGMISARDYDILIYTTSLVMEEYKKNRQESTYKFHIKISDILEFCGRDKNCDEVADIEKSFQRLIDNKFAIEYILRQENYKWEAAGVINKYEITERDKYGTPNSIHIHVSKWVHDLILKSRGKQVLRLTNNYFKTTSSLGRYLYLIGSSKAGAGEATWDFVNLFLNSNCEIPREIFFKKIQDEVAKGIPGFEAAIIAKNDRRPSLLIRREFNDAVRDYTRYN